MGTSAVDLERDLVCEQRPEGDTEEDQPDITVPRFKLWHQLGGDAFD